MAIKGNDSIATTRALFDTGSRRSYATEEVVNSLKLKPIEEQTFQYMRLEIQSQDKKRLQLLS